MSKMRKFRVLPQSTPNSEINITPLVDVVLVLLIIFMVVTPLLEKDIEIRVPDKQEETEQTLVPPDQLVVSVAKDGKLSINTAEVAAEDYVEKLTKILQAKPRGEKLVFFTADGEANYAKLVGALDGARKAGAETLGMATEKVEGVGGAGSGGAEAPPAP
jgi:biopolymer transport protein ExbD